MEFLRFGSSIPGEYWGCCAADIIQNFNQHPDTKASIQLISGDGGGAIMQNRELAFAGPTLKDIFETRIRIGTFSNREMPNHAFFAMLASDQCNSEIGKAWLKILKDNGFEFLRAVNNSVWNKVNYIFVLVRNTGPNSVNDMFKPPASWTALEDSVPEVWNQLGDTAALTMDITKAQKVIWDKGSTKILAESEVIAAGAPVIMAALRTEFPVETKAKRDEKLKKRTDAKMPVQPSGGIQHPY